MNGTWQGKYSGTNSGHIVVELDGMGDHFGGCVYAYDNNPGLPSTFALIRTPDKKRKSKFSAPLVPLDSRTGEPTEWNNVANCSRGSLFRPGRMSSANGMTKSYNYAGSQIWVLGSANMTRAWQISPQHIPLC